MTSVRDPWAVLGIDPSASEEEIRAAYRTRSMLLHPDLHEGRPERVRLEARRAMTQLTQAYEALTTGAAPRRREPTSVAFLLGRRLGRRLR